MKITELVEQGAVEELRAAVANAQSSELAMGFWKAVNVPTLNPAVFDVLAVAATPLQLSNTLMYAALNHRVDAIRLLVERGAKPEPAGLLQLVPKASLEVLALMLDAGANPNAFDARYFDSILSSGASPLLCAIAEKRAPVVELLARRGADVNALDSAVRTPLEVAELVGDAEVLAALRAAGARPVDPARLDLLQAARRGFVDRVRELVAAAPGAAIAEALMQASWTTSDPAVVRVLTEEMRARGSATGDAVVPAGALADALVHAAMLAESHTRQLEAILEAGADPNTPSDYGQLALASAASAARHAAMDLLLARGADVNRADGRGLTALHQAFDSHPAGLKTIEILLAHGANPTLRDASGRTPVDTARKIARDYGDKRYVELFKNAGAKVRKSGEVLVSAKKKVAGHVATAHLPVFADADGESRLGGVPDLAPDEEWPRCETCGAHVLFLAQLHSASLPKPWKTPVKSAKLVQIFVCASCLPGWKNRVLRAIPALGLRRATAPDGLAQMPRRTIASWKGVKDYPFRDAGKEAFYRCQANLDPLELEALRSLNYAGTKCGGWPYWVQDATWPKRADGSRFGRCLLQLTWWGTEHNAFGDGGMGYVFATDDLGELAYDAQSV